MGLAMALNLQKHLQPNGLPALRYSNRTLSKGQPLQDAGAIPENEFQDVVEQSDVIFTMVRGFACFSQTHQLKDQCRLPRMMS
jgi:3-hydroxyisobutyrate dehydrogenase-like beta-hydroxyacid dehydrogenase